jgi:hypothetical protein
MTTHKIQEKIDKHVEMLKKDIDIWFNEQTALDSENFIKMYNAPNLPVRLINNDTGVYFQIYSEEFKRWYSIFHIDKDGINRSSMPKCFFKKLDLSSEIWQDTSKISIED